jgi:hypothetical protein
MPPGVALLVALLMQGASGAAGAGPDGAVTRARLEVRAGAECMSRTDLVARVASRSPRILFVDDAPIAAQVSLTSSRPGNVIAELILAAAGAEQTPRRFVARSCDEAADAIAVIIAVTLDPTLKRRSAADLEQGGARPTDATTAPPAPTAPGDGAAPPAAKPDDQPARAKEPTPPPTVEAPAASRPPGGPALQVGVSLAGQTIFGPAPAVMPGVAVYGMAALDREGLWAPALFIGATHVWRGSLSQPGGAASFTLDAASLDACPLRLVLARLAARPCASALVGRMASSGTETDAPSSFARPFAAVGAAVSAGFGLGSRVEIALRLGIGWTLTRDSYELGTTVFHRAERLTTSASLGIGARWP